MDASFIVKCGRVGDDDDQRGEESYMVWSRYFKQPPNGIRKLITFKQHSPNGIRNLIPTMAKASERAGVATTSATPSSGWIGYVAMALLAVQFGLQPILYKEFASRAKHRSVLVIGCEVCKLVLALCTLVASGAFHRIAKTWTFQDSLVASGLPACTYAVQNVLVQMAYQHLPSIVFNLLNQTKLLSAALFLYLFMNTRFSLQQWFAMLLLLSAAVLLALAEDTPSNASRRTVVVSYELGLVPVLLASLLSGLGSALTQRSMQQHKRDAALVTIELSIYGSLFLLLPAMWSLIVTTPASESPASTALANMDKVFKGCDYYTAIPVVSNALGGILVGTVTRYVGGVLKSFALIGGIACTAFVESFVYGALVPPHVFVAAGLVATSMTIYASFPYRTDATKAKTE
ncbi:hypothetical protein PsorP6_015407 [Peronosclerospora sorghi]|uniref:Uncharacterized protein n=1 Tax=Peronosclerospora sorghi TaxID=230839 RepID=A0ACC0WQA7_9STRA|nr:hypothetical protein PsorP6_015407 [Peronosclerospora sorghi]